MPPRTRTSYFRLTDVGPVRLPDDFIMPADAQRVHLYNFDNVLRPRSGRLEKESLSAAVLEHLRSAFNSWTDPRYGDSVTPAMALDKIVENAHEELEYALRRFRRDVLVDSQDLT